MASSLTLEVRFGGIQCICVDGQDHVAGDEFKGCMRVNSNIVMELVACLLDYLCVFCFMGCYGAKGCS